MKLNNFLKKQFEDFIGVYDNYLIRTLGITLTYSLFCFILIALLVRFSSFDTTVTKRQFSILSYFFSRYSKGDIYSIVDLSKSIFIFFVSIFSIGLTRLNPSKQENTELRVADFLKQIKFNDILDLIGVLILCSILDYLLFRLCSLTLSKVNYNGLGTYLNGLLFELRIYIPLILFSRTTYKLSSNKKFKLNLTKFVFLLISLWLFNEFAYEFSLVVRNHIFELILLPFSVEKQYFIESFIGLLLVAFYFVGYHSAMATSLKLLDNKH